MPDLEAVKGFYTDYLGLTGEEFNPGWVARDTSPETGINLQLITRDATAPMDPVISVKVDDVAAACSQAQQRGYEIVHPLTTEKGSPRSLPGKVSLVLAPCALGAARATPLALAKVRP